MGAGADERDQGGASHQKGNHVLGMLCLTLSCQFNFTRMRRYLIIYEKGNDGYSAYVPDLPGCTSAGATKIEVNENIVEAIKLHIEVMKESGYEIPDANSESEVLVLA